MAVDSTTLNSSTLTTAAVAFGASGKATFVVKRGSVFAGAKVVVYQACANNAADYGKAGVIVENGDSNTCVVVGNEGEYVKAEVVNSSSSTSIGLDIGTA